MRPRSTAQEREPRDVAAATEHAPVLASGEHERLAGYGVMGFPFSSGHYLALRRFPASSIGPAFTSVWWRDPNGRWVIFSDVAPAFSCPRYFGRALERSDTTPIDLWWCGPRRLQVTIPGILEWEVQLGSTFASRILSHVGASAPELLWRNSAALACVGRLAGPLLRIGTLRLAGDTPNGQHFQATPRVSWMVDNSRARIMDADAGPTGPLQRQVRLGDFWLPQRGIFFVGEARYRVVQHRSPRVSPRS